MAADGGLGAAQVAWFPGLVQRAVGELRAGDGVDGIGGKQRFWDGLGFEAYTRHVTGFERAVEDNV